MRISLNWLRDYLDIKSDANIDQIAHSLTMAGLEVEGIDFVKEKAQAIELARIIEKSTDAQGLSWFLLEGHVERFSAKSDLVINSIVGIKSENKGLRLATFGDLGFQAASLELISFAPDYFTESIPKRLSDLSEFDDVIISLGVTPNRPDALSHLGVSRELAALLDLAVRAPILSVREMAGPTHEKAVVEIDNDQDCPRYALRVIENIRVEPSPLWLRMRLLACGLRPINNVVDACNYVMLSRGQPMHAYDYDKLKKENSRVKIIVRRASVDEKFQSIDGKELALSPEDVVVSDMGGVIALAGVMGGLASAVSANTTSVLLESAYFEPKNIRMSARRHQLSSESSYRFERGADPSGVVDALNYAARLLVENSESKSCREPIDAYRRRIDPLEIKMRLDRAQNILGLDAAHFDQEILRRKFLRLGIETVAKRGDDIYFRVPTFRADLVREIDLIEEAARMIGYDKISESVVANTKDADLFANKKVDEALVKMRERLIGRGFFEAMNYAFLNKEHQEYFLDKEALPRIIEIMNPLSERYGVMRVSLVPGLLKNLIHNQRNQEKSIQLFEIGTVFLGRRDREGAHEPALLHSTLDQDSFSIEKQFLAGIMGGLGSYCSFDQAAKPVDFYTLKGVVNEVLAALGLDDRGPKSVISYGHGSEKAYLHPGESARVFLRGHEHPIGFFGKLHPTIAEALDVVGDVFVFELDIAMLASATKDVTRFVNFSRFPVITRDVALLVDESVMIGDILAQAYVVSTASEALSDITVFDIYRGKNISTGKKSVALSITLQNAARTLTDEEAETFVQEFLRLVEQKTGAQVR